MEYSLLRALMFFVIKIYREVRPAHSRTKESRERYATMKERSPPLLKSAGGNWQHISTKGVHTWGPSFRESPKTMEKK